MDHNEKEFISRYVRTSTIQNRLRIKIFKRPLLSIHAYHLSCQAVSKDFRMTKHTDHSIR